MSLKAILLYPVSSRYERFLGLPATKLAESINRSVVSGFGSAVTSLRRVLFHPLKVDSLWVPARVTYKTTRVVVADGFGVAESLQQRIGLEDDVFDALDGLAATRDACNVVHDVLSGHCFTGSRFATVSVQGTQLNQLGVQ